MEFKLDTSVSSALLKSHISISHPKLQIGKLNYVDLSNVSFMNTAAVTCVAESGTFIKCKDAVIFRIGNDWNVKCYNGDHFGKILNTVSIYTQGMEFIGEQGRKPKVRAGNMRGQLLNNHVGNLLETIVSSYYDLVTLYSKFITDKMVAELVKSDISLIAIMVGQHYVKYVDYCYCNLKIVDQHFRFYDNVGCLMLSIGFNINQECVYLCTATGSKPMYIRFGVFAALFKKSELYTLISSGADKMDIYKIDDLCEKLYRELLTTINNKKYDTINDTRYILWMLHFGKN